MQGLYSAHFVLCNSLFGLSFTFWPYLMISLNFNLFQKVFHAFQLEMAEMHTFHCILTCISGEMCAFQCKMNGFHEMHGYHIKSVKTKDPLPNMVFLWSTSLACPFRQHRLYFLVLNG